MEPQATPVPPTPPIPTPPTPEPIQPPIQLPIQPVPAPEQPSNKASQRWLVISSVVFLLVAIILAAFKLILKNKTTTPPEPTSTALTQPTPSPTPDPTANWKTYTNTQYEYTIKYPANYLVGFCDELAGEFIESSGSELQVDILPFTEDIAQKYCPNELDNFLRILVFDIKIFNEFNKPLPELADSIYQQQKSHFKTTYISSLTKSKFDGYDNCEYLFSGPSLFMLGGSESVKDGKYKVIFFQKDANVYSLYLKNSGLFDQILSTFKFTEEKQTQINCKDPRPEVCTMECIQNPPYICGSDGKSYCTICQACSNKNVAWYEMKNSPCEEQ